MWRFNEDAKILLYSSQVSDCSARLRIALNLKALPYELIPLNLGNQENFSVGYATINPQRTVPFLVLKQAGQGDETESLGLSQSVAALEFLDEAFPETYQLLPPLTEPDLRAHVRTLVAIIATDTHPLTTHRVGRARSAFSSASSPTGAAPAAPADASPDDQLAWNKHWIAHGLGKFEKAAHARSGRYSVGDRLTLADVVLVPELWTGSRMGVDLEQFPTIARVFRNLSALEPIRREQSVPEPDGS